MATWTLIKKDTCLILVRKNFKTKKMRKEGAFILKRRRYSLVVMVGYPQSDLNLQMKSVCRT